MIPSVPWRSSNISMPLAAVLIGTGSTHSNAAAAAKITVAITRMRLGNLSNAKGVGSGVQEYRIDFGPGYRIYFGKDGEMFVILLAGGPRSASSRHPNGAGTMGGLQATQKGSKM